jgi:Type II secretory pathway, ATPase PulE/Tfp pilus assembly pathway, ATPase PilB
MARRLVSEGVMPEADVRKAMVDSAQAKATLASWLLDRNLVEGSQITRIASIEFGMPMMDVASLNPATMPLDLISEALISKHQALPLFRRGKRLFVGIADPIAVACAGRDQVPLQLHGQPILVSATRWCG